jgi:hypothetical protein
VTELPDASAARDAKRLLLGLIVLELILVSIYVFDSFVDHPIATVGTVFDLDADLSIPAWFSSVQLFVIALVLLLKARRTDRGLRPSRWFFLIAGIGFAFLSADEGARIHEELNWVLEEREYSWLPTFRYGHGIWIFVYAVPAVALLVALRRDLEAVWNLHPSAARMIAAGIGIIVLGGVGLEIVAYQYLGATQTPRLYPIEVAFEELFEMAGASVVLYGALLLLLPGAGRTH